MLKAAAFLEPCRVSQIKLRLETIHSKKMESDYDKLLLYYLFFSTNMVWPQSLEFLRTFKAFFLKKKKQANPWRLISGFLIFTIKTLKNKTHLGRSAALLFVSGLSTWGTSFLKCFFSKIFLKFYYTFWVFLQIHVGLFADIQILFS